MNLGQFLDTNRKEVVANYTEPKECWRVGVFGLELKSVCIDDDSDDGKTAWVTPTKFQNQERADDYIRSLIERNLIPEPIYTEVTARGREADLESLVSSL